MSTVVVGLFLALVTVVPLILSIRQFKRFLFRPKSSTQKSVISNSTTEKSKFKFHFKWPAPRWKGFSRGMLTDEKEKLLFYNVRSRIRNQHGKIRPSFYELKQIIKEEMFKISGEQGPILHAPQRQKLPADVHYAMLKQGTKSHLAFKHVVPPHFPMTSLTFFGGAPIAPEGFVWPSATERDGNTTLLTFMGQVDCSTIPDGGNRELLPRQGILYFFAPTTGFYQHNLSKQCVRYIANTDVPLMEVIAPIGLPNAPSQSYRVWQKGLPNDLFPEPKFHRKVEMDMGWIETIEFPKHLSEQDTDAKKLDFSVWCDERYKRLSSFYGEPNGLPLLTDHSNVGNEELSGFPWNYHGILVFISQLRGWLTNFEPYSSDPSATPAVSSLPENNELWLQTDSWIKTVLENNLASKPTDFDSKQFQNWVTSLPAVVIGCKPSQNHDAIPAIGVGATKFEEDRLRHANRKISQWLTVAVAESAEFGLRQSAKFKELLPPIVIERLNANHHPYQKHEKNDIQVTAHQMLGVGRDIQGFIGEIEGHKLLLMQFSYNIGINWDAGDVGAFSYAIYPEDLAACKFDNIDCTFEGH